MKICLYNIERIELEFDSFDKEVQAAIDLASQYGLKEEVESLIDMGYSPSEALREWDII